MDVQRVNAARVVALTFTRAAAHELRNRIQEELAGKVAERPTATTLHSYALRNLLSNAQKLDALPQPVRIADDWEERMIVQEDLKALMGAGDVEAIRDRLLALSADWDTLSIEGDPDKRRADPKFVGAWQEHRSTYGYTLRAELVYQLKRALEQRADLVLTPPTDHLLVDEYQDLNACDLAVIDAIRKRGAEVYGAGDDDQSIYGFRHAKPAGIRAFLEEYAPAGDLKLEVCHRCDRGIIDLALFVAKLDANWLEKPLRARDDADEGEVRLLRFNDQIDEANGVASICRYLIDEQDHKPDDVLILLRSDRNRAFSRPIVEALSVAGVPVNLNVGSGTPLDDPDGRIVLAFLRLCHQTADSLAWRTLLQVRRNAIGPAAWSAAYGLARERGISYVQALAMCDTDPNAIPTFGKRIQGERLSITHTLATICPLLTPPDSDQAPPLIERIGQALSGLIEHADKHKVVEEYLRKLVKESDATDLQELLQAISAAESAPEQELVAGAVNVLTMHRAKGLSARTVILTAAEDEYIPGRQQGAAAEDERRLLYVSLTRAKQRLLITFANKRTGQQRHTGRRRGKTSRNLTRYLKDGPVKPINGDDYVQTLGATVVGQP